MLSISPHKIYIGYSDNTRKNVNKKSLKNLKKKKQTNELLDSSKKKLEKAFDWLLYLSKAKTIKNYTTGKIFTHNATFLTLTLPTKQKHEDKEIKALLNQFFTEFQKYGYLKNYIWKAERQKNGNIHFHIITDSYVTYSWYLKTWNRILDKLNYIDKYSKKMKRRCNTYNNYLNYTNRSDTETSRKIYNKSKRMNFRNAPTVNVKNIMLKSNLKEYLQKYISEKEEKGKVIKGKRIGISRALNLINAISRHIQQEKETVRIHLYSIKGVWHIVFDHGVLYMKERILEEIPKKVKNLIFEIIEELCRYQRFEFKNISEKTRYQLSHNQ